jgi:hypothetical protein
MAQSDVAVLPVVADGSGSLGHSFNRIEDLLAGDSNRAIPSKVRFENGLKVRIERAQGHESIGIGLMDYDGQQLMTNFPQGECSQIISQPASQPASKGEGRTMSVRRPAGSEAKA